MNPTRKSTRLQKKDETDRQSVSSTNTEELTRQISPDSTGADHPIDTKSEGNVAAQ
jgi:hypothetical protein